jgi:hypothetical protein
MKATDAQIAKGYEQVKRELMSGTNYALVGNGVIQEKGSKARMEALKRTRFIREYFPDAFIAYTMKPVKAPFVKGEKR